MKVVCLPVDLVNTRIFTVEVQLRKVIASRRRTIAKLEDRINEIMDRIYKAFSESVGVANIREYEENQLRAAQELAERRMGLNSQIARIKNQLYSLSMFQFWKIVVAMYFPYICNVRNIFPLMFCEYCSPYIISSKFHVCCPG